MNKKKITLLSILSLMLFLSGCKGIIDQDTGDFDKRVEDIYTEMRENGAKGDLKNIPSWLEGKHLSYDVIGCELVYKTLAGGAAPAATCGDTAVKSGVPSNAKSQGGVTFGFLNNDMVTGVNIPKKTLKVEPKANPSNPKTEQVVSIYEKPYSLFKGKLSDALNERSTLDMGKGLVMQMESVSDSFAGNTYTIDIKVKSKTPQLQILPLPTKYNTSNSVQWYRLEFTKLSSGGIDFAIKNMRDISSKLYTDMSPNTPFMNNLPNEEKASVLVANGGLGTFQVTSYGATKLVSMDRFGSKLVFKSITDIP